MRKAKLPTWARHIESAASPGTSFRCPHCGAVLNVSGGVGTGDVKTFRTLGYGDGGQAATWREATRTTPSRKANREADVIVPLQQAAITAGVITLPTAILTLAAGWPIHVPVIVGAATFTASWFYLLRDSRGLLRVTERIVNRDIDGDGRIGSVPMAEPQRASVEVSVAEPEHYGGRMSFMNFHVSEAGLLQLARGVTGGRELTERTWTGRGQPFAVRAEFNEFRDQLIGRGYAQWVGRDHRHGWKLTERGAELFKSLASRPHPPAPGGGPA